MQKKSHKKNSGLGVFFLIILTTSQAFAMNSVERRQLKALDPETRLEQRCDIEAMDRIAKDTRFMPDKVLAYAFGDPKLTKNHIIANGAAFRAGNRWYRLSYDCKSKDDAMTILSFKYKIGALVPRKDWDKHYLVP